jgi:hypothetical protein
VTRTPLSKSATAMCERALQNAHRPGVIVRHSNRMGKQVDVGGFALYCMFRVDIL